MSDAPGIAVTFSEAQLGEVRRLQGLYPDTRGALLPVLHMAQETFGWISLDAEEYVAGLFGLSPAHVHEVVTFYTLYFRARPGRHVVSICHNLSCHLAGAPGIIEHAGRANITRPRHMRSLSAPPCCLRGELCPARHAELREDVAQVRVDGVS